MSETEAGNSGQMDAIEAGGLSSERSFDPSLTCFILLAKFLGTPADPAQMIHDRGRGDDPWGIEDFARISKRLGLIAKIRAARLDELSKLPLPALAECRTGANVILLKIEDASLNPRYLGSGPIDSAIEASKWRRYRACAGAAGSIATRKAARVRDRSHFGVPAGFDRFCPWQRQKSSKY